MKTKVYHITYSGEYAVCCIFFWGCNINCRICLLKKEAYDCHLPETRLRLYDPDYSSGRPSEFLSLERIRVLLSDIPIGKTFLMGGEPLCDPALGKILDFLKEEKKSERSTFNAQRPTASQPRGRWWSD